VVYLSGVQDPAYVASAVVSEYRRQQRYRRGGIVDSVARLYEVRLEPKEMARRQRLFAAARRGSQTARARLRALYGLDLILGDGTPGGNHDSSR
jgi:hypothetical protein